jgi:predicted nucleotidyltransferase component of viral defense system
MEHRMKLHHDTKLFSDTLRATAQYLSMKVEFVEKDYWITLVLSRLATSKYVDKSVFKGGTSLSKGYNLIDRFSEDVDLAIINDENAQGNPVKTIIRNIEKEITSELTEVPFEGITSKGSRFRKSVFEYPTTEKNNSNNKLIVEINSFANPFPYQRLSIQSMVHDFLIETKNETYIDTYDLRHFEINVLSKQQTLLEKMVSLIRFSFKEDAVEGISQKIRHFYDLYYLMGDEDCKKYVASASFKSDFDTILQHDRELFEEPNGWQSKSILESPLVSDFPTLWDSLKGKYLTELAAFAFRPIPDEAEIAKCFAYLISRIK